MKRRDIIGEVNVVFREERRSWRRKYFRERKYTLCNGEKKKGNILRMKNILLGRRRQSREIFGE